MQKLITAQEEKEISDNCIDHYMEKAVSDIKYASSMGLKTCQIKFRCNDEEIKNCIKKIEKLGYKTYKITNVDRFGNNFGTHYLIIKW